MSHRGGSKNSRRDWMPASASRVKSSSGIGAYPSQASSTVAKATRSLRLRPERARIETLPKSLKISIDFGLALVVGCQSCQDPVFGSCTLSPNRRESGPSITKSQGDGEPLRSPIETNHRSRSPSVSPDPEGKVRPTNDSITTFAACGRGRAGGASSPPTR